MDVAGTKGHRPAEGLWGWVAARPRTSLAWIIAAGAALRVWMLGAQSLWLDEASTWIFAQRPTLSQIVFSEPVHPPLHKLLVAAWMRLLGEQEATLRALPALFGVLTIVAVYGLCRELLALAKHEDPAASERLARWPHVAAAAVAFSPFLIGVSQELRMYSLVGLLTMTTFYFLARWLRLGLHRDGIALGFVGLLGVYTHYFYAFWLLGALITLALNGWRVGPERADGERRRVLIHALLGGALIAAAFAPWALYVLENFQSVTRFGIPIPAALLYVLLRFTLGLAIVVVDAQRIRDGGLATMHWGEWLIASLAVVTMVGLAVYGARCAWRLRAIGRFFIGGIAAPFAVTLLVIHPLTGLFQANYVIGAAGFWCMLLSAGLLWIGPRARRRGATLALVLVALLGLIPNYASPASIGGLELRWGKENWRGAVSLIHAHASDDAVVLYAPDYLVIPFRYYDRDRSRHLGLPGHSPEAPGEALDAALERLGETDEVWLLISHDWLDETYIELLEARGWARWKAQDFPEQWGIRVVSFRR